MINSSAIGKQVIATVMPTDSAYHRVKGKLVEIRSGYAIIEIESYSTIWDRNSWMVSNPDCTTSAQVQYVKEI